ncbi:MAG: biotin/lipoyl-containing protein [Geminicoccaceae bacterium]
MPHEITMPQLGMSQDTGIIVAWHKQAGDKLSAGDVLMEVETDKTTMEVEADREGYLAEIRAEAGVPVPVGDVIAVIGDQPGASPKAKPLAPKPPTEAKEYGAAKEPANRQEKAAEPDKPIIVTNNRVLASPKAKAEARRRGLDLERLVKLGVPQPFHLADLEKLEAEPVQVAVAPAPSALRARIDRTDFDRFADWAREETDGAVTPAMLWTVFATGAFRQALGHDRKRSLLIQTTSVASGGEPLLFADSDLSGLSSLSPVETDARPDLAIRDMTATALIDYSPGGPVDRPTLTIVDTGAHEFTLHFTEQALPFERAAALLNALAKRGKDPLRHLL